MLFATVSPISEHAWNKQLLPLSELDPLHHQEEMECPQLSHVVATHLVQTKYKHKSLISNNLVEIFIIVNFYQPKSSQIHLRIHFQTHLWSAISDIISEIISEIISTIISEFISKVISRNDLQNDIRKEVWNDVWSCTSEMNSKMIFRFISPSTCIVHHGSQGGPTFFRSKSHPNIFHFLVVHMVHSENRDFLSIFGGSQGQTTDSLFVM